MSKIKETNMKAYVLRNVTKKQTINLLKYAHKRNIRSLSEFSDIPNVRFYPTGIVSLHVWETAVRIRFQHDESNNGLFSNDLLYLEKNTTFCNNIEQFKNKIWENSNV